ncbi:putative fatty acyl CoA syntetase 1 [Leishmania infantum JPCM5]|uniref:Long-chain-fatty-acid-CoA_ligase_-_putative n=2 Tax=Leishmania infantum TaxID=5671 RepID=A0A6L0WRA1_LEIIN|nr:putative fatty acyl CoA syntetase 1 [Leishmania infantum JPCM5]CAC9436692.1 long-chain-fatty-acid-CoA_ligase_-_putative [Leishmania infantum]CAM65200.1 putative fatty acyl CoA syntetase 1 [Leishmania infantum JPCM5]SUZ38587.1 long-chain-fatty-acid-CoA_ligase_-_putative [Leishmania infantum]|eukprot:XP_001462662.1 putative fatty acyl CoA syntetase 1 [Leishmania infantum JPCM5]
MGGCVVSLMEVLNSTRLVEHPDFAARRVYGVINQRVTEDEADRSGVYRCARLTDAQHVECFNWYDGPTILQRLAIICTERGDQRAMAYRTVEKVVKESTKDEKGGTREWAYTFLNEPTYITYAEVWSRLVAFGRGLVELGLQKGSHVALYEDTRWEWLVTMLGVWTQEMIGVTVYANLGEDALLYALKEATCEALVCNGKNVGKLISLMDKYGVHNATIIYLDALPSNLNTESHKVVAWADVLAKGTPSTAPYKVQDNKDEEVLVMYTSGTTGNPKGVVHTIGALTQGALGLEERLTELIGKEENESYVAYLPAAHIFEFTCENIMLLRGALICFGTPRTLTDTYARPCGDLRAFNPFFFIGVPRIFETIKKAVEAKLPPVGTLKRQVFDHAYQSRLAALKEGKDTPYWNEKVFSLPRRILGSKVRGICCGGAPLSDKTQEWLSVVLGRPVAQGYGMTESVCNASVQRSGELKCEVGQLLHGVEARLLDTEHYKHTDKPHPRGELLLRGRFVFKGYYKQPELTEQSILPGGWLRTGDVAEMEAETGQMRIIGRVKALAKNCLGEYIALENLEALYCECPVVAPNGICVLVDPQQPFITALVLTDEEKAMKFARAHKFENARWPDILKDPAFIAAVTASLAEIGRKAGKKSFELLKRVCVLSDEWTPENNLVTASMKVRRSAIDKHYAGIIKELFAD